MANCHLKSVYNSIKMKKILVPIDFSETAFGAALYAAEMAQSISAKLILFHAYHPPLPAVGADYGILPDLDLDKENLIQLESFKSNLLKRISALVEMDCAVKIGFAVDEIIGMAAEIKADLIVMGISGGGSISEYVLGSNTTMVTRRAAVPVLIVPPKAKFKIPGKLVFACDYKVEVSSKAIEVLKEFIHLFPARLLVLNLEDAAAGGVSFDKAVNGIQLENALSNIVHTLHFLPKVGDIAEEINDFMATHEADILITIPHRHSLLYRIFNESFTKHLAFHSYLPVLALRE